MQIRLLGPTEVVRGDGELVALGAAKVRLLAVFLACEPGRVRSVDAIIDCLWDDEPPASSANLVQGYVSDLRRAIGAERVERKGTGYALAVEASSVDLVRFQQLQRAAHELLEQDPDRARSMLEECASLVRGAVFADIPVQGPLMATKVRVDESLIELEQDRVALDLAAGRHQGLVARLEELTATHPLREVFWAQLALALYRSGRQADALRRCQQIRQLLREEIGVSPGPQLVDIEQRIARQDPSLALPATSTTPTATPVAGAGTPSQVVGRLPEIDRLKDRLQRAGAGHQLVFIAGEPGIGKSTLAVEIGRRAALDGAVVLHGRCDEHVGSPYLPFVDALLQHLRPLSSDDVGHIVGDRRDLVAELLPSLTLLPRSSAPPKSDEERLSMVERFEALAWLLDRVRGDASLVLILDDLQWADSTTLGLLGYLASGQRLTRTLMLATYRSTELHANSRLADLLAELRGSPHAERMLLTGLSVEEISRLVPTTDERSIDDFAAWIHDETGGNPLFVRELVRHVEETGQRSGVPEGVVEVVSRRVRRLSDAAQQALENAAVLGDEFTVALLRVLNPDVRDLGGVAREVERAGMWSEHPVDAEAGYRFTHSTIRRAVTDLTSIVTREELHLRAAHALSQLDRTGTAAMNIAAHYLAAGSAAAPDEAFAAFVAAGSFADQSWAKAEAVQWYDRAMALLPADDPRRRALRLTRFVAAQGAWHWHHDSRSIRV
jgi:DNA-binding SARP family transcriptional activator